jgi:Splicing factor 3a, subunit 3
MESFQQLRVYQLAEKISNEIWFIVKKRDDFAKDTMGKQIVRSADSVGALILQKDMDAIAINIISVL